MTFRAGTRRLLGAVGLVALAGGVAGVAARGGPRGPSAVALCREVRVGAPLREVVARARASGLDVVEGEGAPPGAVLVWSGDAPWRRFCVVRHRDERVTGVEESAEP